MATQMSIERPSPTAILGKFVSQTARTALPPSVAEKAACCLLDALGLAILARDEETVSALRSLATPVADRKAAGRIWPDDTWVVLSEAVTINAAAVHALFQDDNDGPSWSHPASLVTPVAVCAGESVNASLASVLRATAIGYGTIAWLGAKERVARALIQRGIRTSPTLGTVAAAAAAAAIYESGEDEATSALGIASSITGGVLEPVRCGSDEWRIQNAHAARGGLLAAQLSMRGTRGADEGLEGPKGLVRSLASLDAVPEWLFEPTVESILDVWAKPWATLGDNVPAIAAAQALRDSGVPADKVTKIYARIWRHYAEYPGTSYRGPFNSVAQAIASTAFGISAMLALGELDYQVSVTRRRDPIIARLVPLVTIEPHDGNSLDASVEVVLADGSKVSRTAADAPRTLLFHDQPTAISLFERRLAVSGWPLGAGTRIATEVFDVARGVSTMSARQFLDLLSSTRTR
jgi:2-methylcitrate dehydratase PrpD